MEAKQAVIGAASRGADRLMAGRTPPPASSRWPMLLVILAVLAGIAAAVWLAGALQLG